MLDDGVTELAKHARRLSETLHTNAVRRVDVKSCQHGVTNTGAKHNVMLKVLVAWLAVRREVHVKPVDQASVRVVLRATHKIKQLSVA